MGLREIADNTGMKPRKAELARAREFDEPFYFTSADEKAITRFVEAARAKGFDARRGKTFWHFSSKCDTARALRTVAQLFRDATHIKLTLVGIGGSDLDLPWLRAVDLPVLLPGAGEALPALGQTAANPGRTKTIVMGDASGAVGWNRAILDIIR